MQLCWDEDHSKRPNSKVLEVALKQLDPQRIGGDPLDNLVNTLEVYSTNLENVVHSR